LKNKKQLKIFENFKNLVFVTQDNTTGSSIISGIQPYNYYKNLGLNCLHVLDRNLSKTDIKDSIVLHVKWVSDNKYYEDIAELKKYNNKIFLITIDGHMYRLRGKPFDGFSENMPPKFLRDFYDGYILNSKFMVNEVSPFVSSGKLLYYLYQPPIKDMKSTNTSFNSIKIGYFGAKFQFTHSSDPYIKTNVKPFFNWKGWREQPKQYNLHYNIRRSRTYSYLYKPAAKLFTAAAAGANLITTKDRSYLELMGEDYPYYTNYKVKDVIQTIEFIKESYGSKTWNDALSIMEEIKHRTCEDTIFGKDLINFLEKAVDL
jgi:hypothetical protein